MLGTFLDNKLICVLRMDKFDLNEQQHLYALFGVNTGDKSNKISIALIN
jgi:hypothetical protein